MGESSLVTVEKKDKEKSLRLCIDPSELNNSISNGHAHIPTYDDLDLKNGFWHVKLNDESGKLFAFSTSFGLRKL